MIEGRPQVQQGGVMPPSSRSGKVRRALISASLLSVMLASAPVAFAQQPRPPAPAPQSTSAGGASASSRTEIVTYDNWTVTCREGRDPKDRRICSGELNIYQEANNARRIVFSWLIGQNRDGQPAMALRFLPGVSVQPGVELKLGDKPARRMPIATCEPAYCEVSQPMDDSLLRDASAANQAEAMIVASDGRQVTFTIYLKGFAQAVAAVRK